MKKSRFFELYTFGYHLLKKSVGVFNFLLMCNNSKLILTSLRFFSCFENLGDKLAPEILFWKGAKECYEIENGYGTYEQVLTNLNCLASNVLNAINGFQCSDAKKHTKEDGVWTWFEELEDELRSLYNEYRDMVERPQGCFTDLQTIFKNFFIYRPAHTCTNSCCYLSGMDVLDFIEPNLSRPRTRKQILSKLKEFNLDPLGAKANKGQGKVFVDSYTSLVIKKKPAAFIEEMDTTIH